jgi:hypothetical protein
MPRWMIRLGWWNLLWLLLFVFIDVALLAAYVAEQKRRTPFWHKYLQVQRGMTRAEVEKILGPPKDECSMGGGTAAECFRWVEGEQEIYVDFIPLPADKFGGYREVVIGKQFRPRSEWQKLWDKLRGAD